MEEVNLTEILIGAAGGFALPYISKYEWKAANYLR
jgi:hypothetical protein